MAAAPTHREKKTLLLIALVTSVLLTALASLDAFRRRGPIRTWRFVTVLTLSGINVVLCSFVILTDGVLIGTSFLLASALAAILTSRRRIAWMRVRDATLPGARTRYAGVVLFHYGPTTVHAAWYDDDPEQAGAGVLPMLAALGDLPPRFHEMLVALPAPGSFPGGAGYASAGTTRLVFAGDLPGVEALPGGELPPAPAAADLVAVEKDADSLDGPHLEVAVSWTRDPRSKRRGAATGSIELKLPRGNAVIRVHPGADVNVVGALQIELARPWRNLLTATPTELAHGLPMFPPIEVTVIRL